MTTRLPGLLSCKELVELITDYLEKTLPHGERVRFEQHLTFCGGCSAYVEQLRAQVRATARLAEEELDPRVRDDLLRAFRGWKKPAGGSG